MPVQMIEIIGYLAAFLSMATLVPQALKTARSGKSGDISTAAILIAVGANLSWISFGMGAGVLQVVLSNAFALIFSGGLLFMKLKHKKEKPPQLQKGTRVVITFQDSPMYQEMFYLLWPIPNTKMWAYGRKPYQALCSGYAGPSQFKVIE